MTNVIKRSGRETIFNEEKIKNAIEEGLQLCKIY